HRAVSLSLPHHPSRLPPRSALSPYTTLFRSLVRLDRREPRVVLCGGDGHIAHHRVELTVGRDVPDAAPQRAARRDGHEGPASQQIGRAHVCTPSHVSSSYAVFCLKKKNRRPS